LVKSLFSGKVRERGRKVINWLVEKITSGKVGKSVRKVIN
jgi:hypothetical protein